MVVPASEVRASRSRRKAVVAIALGACFCACPRKTSPDVAATTQTASTIINTRASVSAPSSASSVAKDICRPVAAPATYPSNATPVDENHLPFAAELGSAIAFANGFLVGVKGPSSTGERILLWHSKAGGPPIVVHSFHEGQEAPWLFGSQKGALVAQLAGDHLDLHLVPSNNEPPKADTSLTPIDTIGLQHQGAGQDNDSPDAAIATFTFIDTATGLLGAWDDTNTNGGTILLRHVGASSAAAKPAIDVAPTKLSVPATGDSGRESLSNPTLFAAPGGRVALIWLAEDAVSPDENQEDNFDANTRWAYVALLDPKELKLAGLPLQLVPKDSHIQSYSAAFVGDDLYVLGRDDTRPMGDESTLLIVHTRLSGNAFSIVDSATIASPKSSWGPAEPGVPFFGQVAGKLRAFWESSEGETLRRDPDGSIRIEPDLKDRSVIAAADDSLLSAKPVGVSLEFTVLRCP